MVEVAHSYFGADLDRFRTDPCEALDRWPDVALQLVEEPEDAADRDACSVAGAYIETGPGGMPVIQVGLAASPGRRAFTALHELGHHLQRTTIDLVEVIWNQNAGDLFEDLACDAFAAEMLLPDVEVSRYIDDEGPTTDDIIRLFQAGPASRSAVCVRAAQRLPAPGLVALLTNEGQVFFCSTHNLPPLRRGSNQSADPVLERGLTNGRSSGRGHFTYRDDIRGQELFIQTAAFDGDLLLAVAVTDSAPWEDFALPSRDAGPRAATYECADLACGATYTSWEQRCPRCAVPPCTECGRCACVTTTAERQCMSCFLVQPSAGFVGDRCDDCA
ncbi:ImmA/IrrE family metallo-endopeptidase [Marmoricola endophyticus]|nr:ImmA/IrrE family metallo-endopeptidase [Marmoricola endophyticus]